MASSKEQSNPRPVSGSFPRNPTASRHHSHSVSLGASHPSHRVNRRKSVNAGASNIATAAVAAALREQGDASAMPFTSHRKSHGSRKATDAHSMSSRPNMAAYFSGRTHDGVTGQDQSSDALDDNSNEDEAPSETKLSTKNRNRRASEGSYLTKGEGKRMTSELRCESCGKGYKHSSCLTKHMWEHDPAWQYTSKLLISKHQQVQLLEAASVLFNMNTESAPGIPDASQIEQSEGSSASPGFSGSSDLHDETSSVETTPPPMSEASYPVPDYKRFSTSSAGFSRSYRSIPSSSYAESVISPGLPPHRLSGVDLRPGTSGTDDGGLAAAAELLNFGTPRTRATHVLMDVPPVPPLPQQYQTASKLKGSRSTPAVYNPLTMHPPALTQQVSDERAFRMEHNGRYEHNDHAHTEDEEMFRMEE